MNLNPFSLFFRPKPIHVVPRFHAATKAEKRRADDLAAARRKELEACTAGRTAEQRAAARERALTVQFHKQGEGRA